MPFENMLLKPDRSSGFEELGAVTLTSWFQSSKVASILKSNPVRPSAWLGKRLGHGHRHLGADSAGQVRGLVVGDRAVGDVQRAGELVQLLLIGRADRALGERDDVGGELGRIEVGGHRVVSVT